MKQMITLTFKGLLAASICGALAPAPTHAQATCASDGCHANLLAGKRRHEPVGACDTCHEKLVEPHPQKGKRTFKLASEVPTLCQDCHEPFEKANVHKPAKEGLCTKCHDPHSATEPKLVRGAMKGLCGQCHADHISFTVLHGPVENGACTACHAPHESDAPKLLVKQPPELCFGCHLEIQQAVKKKHVHPALEMGCTECHNPHGSAHRRLLSAEGQDACFECHDEIAENVAKAAVPHPALKSEKGCISCHDPHASDNPKLLASPQKDTCLGCHKDLIGRTATVLHRPIEEGKCAACHEPHGSKNPKLLVREFPSDVYVPYTDTSYALCFGCHSRDLLQYPDTSFATGFRDGERNLHYVHVHNTEKGRSCKLCHAVHASSNPKLIADTVPFGSWSLPIKYAKTETGGSCAPGCHKPRSYDRKSPGSAPSKETSQPRSGMVP